MNAFLPDTLLKNANHTTYQGLILELAQKAYQNEGKKGSGDEISKSLDVCKKHIDCAIHLVKILGTPAPQVKVEAPDDEAEAFAETAVVPTVPFDSGANLLDYSNLPNDDADNAATEAFFNQDGVDIMFEIDRARSHLWFGDFEAYIKTDDAPDDWVFGT